MKDDRDRIAPPESRDYSLDQMVRQQGEGVTAEIAAAFVLQIEERDIRCTKGDCWRDCADCG